MQALREQLELALRERDGFRGQIAMRDSYLRHLEALRRDIQSVLDDPLCDDWTLARFKEMPAVKALLSNLVYGERYTESSQS